MVGAAGFEPATPCAQGRCATRLRYAPTLSILLQFSAARPFACFAFLAETLPELRLRHPLVGHPAGAQRRPPSVPVCPTCWRGGWSDIRITSDAHRSERRSRGAGAWSIDQRTRCAMNVANGAMSMPMLARSSADRYGSRSSTRMTVHG